MSSEARISADLSSAMLDVLLVAGCLLVSNLSRSFATILDVLLVAGCLLLSSLVACVDLSRTMLDVPLGAGCILLSSVARNFFYLGSTMLGMASRAGYFLVFVFSICLFLFQSFYF